MEIHERRATSQGNKSSGPDATSKQIGCIHFCHGAAVRTSRAESETSRAEHTTNPAPGASRNHSNSGWGGASSPRQPFTSSSPTIYHMIAGHRRPWPMPGQAQPHRRAATSPAHGACPPPPARRGPWRAQACSAQAAAASMPSRRPQREMKAWTEVGASARRSARVSCRLSTLCKQRGGARGVHVGARLAFGERRGRGETAQTQPEARGMPWAGPCSAGQQ